MTSLAGETGDVAPPHHPYPASWLDRLQTALERSPVPLWACYLGLWLVHFGLVTGVKWWDGTYPVGTIFPFHGVTGGTGLLALAFIHYLDHSATAALRAFRPVLNVHDEDYALLHYRLTHLPARKTLLAAALGVLVALAELATLQQNPAVIRELQLFTSPLASAVEVTTYLLAWIFYATFIYHTVHQLRLVGFIYRDCSQVNLFRLDPLHSFSWLTARTSVGVVLIPYIYLLASADLYSIKPEWFAYTVAFTLVAGLTFVWPLVGIHRLLEREKRCLLREASLQLEAAIGRLHESATAGDLAAMDGLNKLMSSLMLEQAALEKISTWPWRPETPRLLATALLLPLVVYLGQRALTLTLGL